jgi:hypothetical protein
MRELEERHLLFLSAPYLVYIICFVVAKLIGWTYAAGIINTIVQTVLDILCAILAFRISRLSYRDLRTLFLIFGSAFAINVVMDIAYGGLVNIAGLQPTRTPIALAYMIPYTLFLLCCFYAWIILLLSQLKEHRGDTVMLLLALLVLLGLFAVFLLHYSRRFQNNLNHFQDIFHAIFAILELFGLVLALICLLTRTAASYILLVAGFSLMVATDFVLCQKEIDGTLGQNEYWEIAWTMAQFLMLLGLIFEYKSTILAKPGGEQQLPDYRFSVRSALASILLIISLGAVLVSTLASLAIESHGSRLFLSMTLITLATILIVRIAMFYDKALDYTVRAISYENNHRLEHVAMNLSRMLRLTGLDEVVTAENQRKLTLRNTHIELGKEIIFDPCFDKPESSNPSCFIVMPYTQAWSEHVYEVIKEVCQEIGVRCVRGDEQLPTPDVLTQIWKDINNATFIIADISGQSPNVMYEVGLAHAIGKPVLFLAQSTDNLPFDLRNRRIVDYTLEPSGNRSLRQRLNTALQRMKEHYATVTHEVQMLIE